MKPIYLDYSATTPVRSEVFEAMLPFFMEEFANSGSIHDAGQRAKDAIERARKQIARAIGASSPRDIIFTGSGTEANNLAIIGAARQRKTQGNHIITTQIEHPAVLEPCRYLEKEGFEVTYLPVDSYGRVSVEDVKSAITDRTILISIMAANNEVGTLQPIREIGELVRDTPILFHTDAIQYFGKLPMNVEEWGVDLASIASHKIYGPKGVAALYIRKGVRIQPIFFGGGQERNLRPSTLNTPAIVGFGLAAELAVREMEETGQRIKTLRDLCWQRIQTEIGGVTLNGHPELRLPNNLNISFSGVEGQAVMLELNRAQIFISSGSACSAGKHMPSHVLKAMGKSDEEAYQSLRITLGKDTTEKEIGRFIEKLKEVLHYLRSLFHNE